jgi:hypothetical protein
MGNAEQLAFVSVIVVEQIFGSMIGQPGLYGAAVHNTSSASDLTWIKDADCDPVVGIMRCVFPARGAA